MKTLHMLVLAFLMLIGPALAESKKPALTNAEALSLLQALRTLDGRQVIVKQGTNESVVMQPWDFGSGTLRLRIARNITALAAVEKTVDEARQGVVKELLKTTTAIAPGTPADDSFRVQIGEILKEGAQVDLSRIKASELRLDKNEIPVTALSALTPILDDDVTPK